MKIARTDALELATRLLVERNTPQDNAAAQAEALVGAELKGHPLTRIATPAAHPRR